jgi:prepilin-type processing-associated H-X9-DG protein
LTAWPDNKACSYAQITDGRSQTVLVVEWPESNIVWTEPRDLPMEAFGMLTSPTPKQIRSPHRHSGGMHFAMADGSVRFQRFDSPPIHAVRALLTRAGGEDFDFDDLDR